MGISDGHDGFLTTLAYYRSTYVFVYPEGSAVEVTSLEDPELRRLRIAVSGGGRTGPERLALASHGLVDNQLTFAPDFGRPAPLTSPISAVLEGEADVAIVWGPVAGHAASLAAVPLELVPVGPQLGRAFLPMVIPISIGVRPHDEALRDRLNRALASRWQEIESVLRSHAVPLEPLPEPSLGISTTSSAEAPLTIGVVLPAPTASLPIDASAPDAAAEAALRGALLADEDPTPRGVSRQIAVVTANAPTPQAVRRAAERLVTADGVFALVGGLGEGQAAVMSDVAEEHGVLFFNIGSSETELREEAGDTTFHLEASGAMYLRATVGGAAENGANRWFLVHDSAQGELVETARRSVAGVRGSSIVGSVAVEDSGDFMEAIEAIRETEADAVLMLLNWREQLEFLGLYDALGLEPLLAGMPQPTTQTRSFYLALQVSSTETDALHRVALWEPTLDDSEAEELAQRFFGRWGTPMDAPAWAAYQAVSILRQAVAAVSSAEADMLVAFLEDGDSVFEVAKGDPVRFRAEDHQLLQPLYLVEIDSDTEDLIELASVTRQLAP